MAASESQAMACPEAGCGAALEPFLRARGSPDYWIRHGSGYRDWTFSSRPPRVPVESEADAAYRCPSCAKTFRLVVPLGGYPGAGGAGRTEELS